LQFSVVQNQKDIVEFLVGRGCDTKQTDKQGLSLFQLAGKMEALGALEGMLDSGVSGIVEKEDPALSTPWAT